MNRCQATFKYLEATSKKKSKSKGLFTVHSGFLPWPSRPVMWSRMAGEGTCYTFYITVKSPPAENPAPASTVAGGHLVLEVHVSRGRRRGLGTPLIGIRPRVLVHLVDGGVAAAGPASHHPSVERMLKRHSSAAGAVGGGVSSVAPPSHRPTRHARHGGGGAVVTVGPAPHWVLLILLLVGVAWHEHFGITVTTVAGDGHASAPPRGRGVHGAPPSSYYSSPVEPAVIGVPELGHPTTVTGSRAARVGRRKVVPAPEGGASPHSHAWNLWKPSLWGACGRGSGRSGVAPMHWTGR